MATQSNGTGEWVKWAVGIALLLSGGAFGYALQTEHRMTSTENAVSHAENQFSEHVKDSRETKADVYRRLERQDENINKVLTGINTVALDVAEIKGYVKRPKTPNE